MKTSQQELFYKVANTEYELESSYKLRYKVYCKEKQWIPSEKFANGMEIDEYDSNAVHVLGVDLDINAVGNMRILPSDRYKTLPYRKHPGLNRNYKEPSNTAELSRLIVSIDSNRMNVTRGLLRAVYQVSVDMGIENWIFVVEPSLVRLLQRFGFYLDAVGTPAKYFGGFTLAAICNIAKCEYIWRTKRIEAWEFYQENSIILPKKSSVA